MHLEQKGVYISGFVQEFMRFFQKGLTSVAVPGFFIISGFLLFRHFDLSQLKKKYISRFRSLLIPYLVWNVISVVWAVLLESIPFLSSNITGTRERFQLDFKAILKGIFLYKYNNHFWFVYSLILFVIITPVIYYLIKNKTAGIISILILFCLYVLNINIPLMPSITDNMQAALIFYMVGAYVGYHYFDSVVNTLAKRNSSLKVFILLFIALSAIVLDFTVFYENRWVNVILWFIYFVSLCLLMENVIDIKCFRSTHFWESTSFFLFASHGFVEPCVCKLINLIMPINISTAYINLFLGTILTVVICLLMAGLLRKSPKIWSILTGNR